MIVLTRKKIYAGLGLVLALVFPALPVSRWENEFKNVHHLLGYEAIWWAVVAVLLIHVRFVERAPLASLGFARITLGDFTAGALGGALTLAGVAAIFLAVFPLFHIHEGRQLDQLKSAPLWWRLISVARAAVGEEVLFRGYAISRLHELSGSAFVAICLSWAIFTLEHVGIWGWGHMLIAGFGGAALTLLFVWRNNLWVSIIAHALMDGATVLS